MQNLTIIAGSLKNQKIKTVDDPRTKYTPSKVKNAIFSIIDSKANIIGANFLDLCSGSGQIGFEAISRGAKSCTFVDISPLAIKTLKRNVEKLNLSDQVKIFKKDVIRFIKKTPEKYDMVFIDPPFNEGLFYKIINELLRSTEILTQDGIILIESKDNYEIRETRIYQIEGRYTYSGVKIDVLKRKGK